MHQSSAAFFEPSENPPQESMRSGVAGDARVIGGSSAHADNTHPGRLGVEQGDVAHHPSARFGRFLFRFRSFIPIPVALALVLVSFRATESKWVLIGGPVLVVVGQTIRLWAVRHIGVISRTRTAWHGPLITRGPYALIRNPLYVGNWFLWTGFVLWSELLWMLPIAWAVYWMQYGAITRWEEASLRHSFGEAYEEYVAQVPPWIPGLSSLRQGVAETAAGPHSWQHVHFSERGTLLAVGIMSLLLILKEAVR